ncbi:protein PRY1 [Nematostella vectensis]|nr:protein PRY1 [Nematostella vectensis]
MGVIFRCGLLASLICSVLSAPGKPTPVKQDDDSQFKSLVIQGVAKYKPGGGSMVLSLIIQGAPGLMPGGAATTPGPSSAAPTSAAPTSAGPTTGGQTSGSTPGGTTAAPQTTPGGATSAASATPNGNAPTASPTIPKSGADEEALKAHNRLRKVHGVPAMTLDKELSKKAQAWAEKIAKDGDGSHDNNRGNVGENWNIACRPEKKSPTAAVVTWYNEVCKPGYTFGTESMGAAGHFTQVVWKSSTKMGFGMAEGTFQNFPCVFSVARYDKPGNYANRFSKNVVKGNFDRAKYCSKVKDRRRRRKRYDLPRFYIPEDLN